MKSRFMQRIIVKPLMRWMHQHQYVANRNVFRDCVKLFPPIIRFTLSNPVPWQNWMAAYLGYTLRMRTLFRGWPITVNDTHTRRRRRSDSASCPAGNSRSTDQLHRKPVSHSSWAGGTVRLGAVGWQIGDVAMMRHLLYNVQRISLNNSVYYY